MKLGSKQREMLIKICKTNGGGLFVSGPDQKVIFSLEKKGLVQGKAGQQYCAVHTKKGLEIYRSLTNPALG